MSITIAQELYKIHNTLSTMYRIANDKHTPKRKKIFNLNFDTVHVFQYACHEKNKNNI